MNETVPNRPWEPWIGDHYGETHLLILGECVPRYRDPETTIWTDREIDFPKQVVRSSLAGDLGGLFTGFLSRGLAGQADPTTERLEFVWHRVAFTFFVPGAVFQSNNFGRWHPSDKQWEVAQQQFPALLETLRPKRVVVLGSALWMNMPPPRFFNDSEEMWIRGFRLEDHSPVLCWGLPHPVASPDWGILGWNWRRLAEVIHWLSFDELQDFSVG